ncbi:hypothetical protein CF15_00460 [Pyrodictium occultum]|uniref:Uncharacterized protein n=1 Tax=Pyrodictium occultum TaxID=2309 RepID=A0A0V8RTS5_PYROC|nr:hypothetical protein [Pyrodictium occultum]KSW11373.1 hypothetical protein CF15_00460 [Pyrodictium occultum]
MPAPEMAGARKRILWALVGVVGYILSPLSWWNDAFVNVPIALAVAWVLERLFGLAKPLGFYIGYTASNVLGLYLLALGVGGAAARKPTWRQLLKIAVVGAVYTVIATLVLSWLGLL